MLTGLEGQRGGPVGPATPLKTRLRVEMAQPWQREVLGSRRSAEGLQQVDQGARDGSLLGAFAAVLPDREYSRKGHPAFSSCADPPGP